MADDGDEMTLEDLHDQHRSPSTTPVAVRLPDPLLAEVDDLWEEGGFANRSEFIRTVLREVAEDPTRLDGALSALED